MKDLFLTSRGDLAIEEINETHRRLEINFVTSKSNALRLNFFIEDTYQKKPTRNSLMLNFLINKPVFNKEMKIISGDMCIEQAIKIRLASALGSIKGNKTIGSKIETIIHEYVDQDNTYNQLNKIIKEAISDIIPNPIITIIKPKSKYLDYSTELNIYIIDGDKKYNINI